MANSSLDCFYLDFFLEPTVFKKKKKKNGKQHFITSKVSFYHSERGERLRTFTFILCGTVTLLPTQFVPHKLYLILSNFPCVSPVI